MRIDKTQRSVLLVGKSQLVLDAAVAGLRDLGYRAAATNEFTDVTGRFDMTGIDLVVFGGQVPPDRKAELTEQIRAIQPQVIFVGGLAGIPGLIVSQVQDAFTSGDRDASEAPAYTPEERSIRLTLADPADVTVTAWWQTPSVGPDPESDWLLVLNDRLPRGEHTIRVPTQVPRRAAFATVEVNAATYAFGIAE